VVKILQGSVVTQTTLGGLTSIHPPVANCPQCICARNYANWLAVDKVIVKISQPIFGPPCILYILWTMVQFKNTCVCRRV